jgi:hypothetical protein
MSEYKEGRKTVVFTVTESDHFRLQTLARIHYEGKMSMLVRALVTMSLDDVESGNKYIGLRK